MKEIILFTALISIIIVLLFKLNGQRYSLTRRMLWHYKKYNSIRIMTIKELRIRYKIPSKEVNELIRKNYDLLLKK